MNDILQELHIEPHYTTNINLKFGDRLLITDKNIDLLRPYLSEYKWRSGHKLTDKPFYRPDIIITIDEGCHYYDLYDEDIPELTNIKYYIPIDL